MPSLAEYYDACTILEGQIAGVLEKADLLQKDLCDVSEVSKLEIEMIDYLKEFMELSN